VPKLSTPEGEQLDTEEIERRFSRAMAEPEPDEPTAPAPARSDPDQAPVAAPSNEGQDAADEGKNTRPRTRRAGPRAARPKASGKGRSATKAQPEEGAYVQPVTEFLQGLTYAAALTPLPPGALAVRVRLQGALVDEHTAGLAAAIDAAARHNETIRRGVESLTGGAAGWVLPAALAVMPFAMASAQLWRMPVDENVAAAAAQFQRSTLQRITGEAGGGDQADAAAAA